MEKKLTFYDIYGFVIAVDGAMQKAFDLEYWRFKTQHKNKADLYVIQTDKQDLPIKLRQDNKGIYIHFLGKEKKVLYEKGVRPDWVLYTVEPLINWKDKCFLHCGSVEKNGEAILFPAEGGVGKTTMATYLIQKGYGYLSDDWLIVGSDGKAYPFFKTLHIYDYNLKKDKKMAKRILGRGKFYYYSFLISLLDLIPKIVPHRFIRMAAERFKPIFSIDVSKLHEEAKLGKISKIKKIYWLKKDKKARKAYLVKSDYKKVAGKMPYITALETNHFYKNYLEWVYSNQQVKEIENKIEFDRKILESAFKNAEVYELFVPDKINPHEVYMMLK